MFVYCRVRVDQNNLALYAERKLSSRFSAFDKVGYLFYDLSYFIRASTLAETQLKKLGPFYESTVTLRKHFFESFRESRLK